MQERFHYFFGADVLLTYMCGCCMPLSELREPWERNIFAETVPLLLWFWFSFDVHVWSCVPVSELRDQWERSSYAEAVPLFLRFWCFFDVHVWLSMPVSELREPGERKYLCRHSSVISLVLMFFWRACVVSVCQCQSWRNYVWLCTPLLMPCFVKKTPFVREPWEKNA